MRADNGDFKETAQGGGNGTSVVTATSPRPKRSFSDLSSICWRTCRSNHRELDDCTSDCAWRLRPQLPASLPEVIPNSTTPIITALNKLQNTDPISGYPSG
jgi:hypothetical protein